MKIERIHHVAYRSKDARETALWYQQMPTVGFVLAHAENLVPSTWAPDPNTPSWVQHTALNQRVVAIAQEKKIVRCRRMRVDTTVVAPRAGANTAFQHSTRMPTRASG